MPLRIRSILVASDLSENAGEVLRTASDLAALTEAELHVVHAAEGAASSGASATDSGGAAAHALGDRLRQGMPHDSRVASSRVEPGRAHEVILRRAREVRADLIVIGPHRELPGVRQALGTTADRIVRTSDEPCLIVHGAVSLPLRRMLIPSDLSDAARGALDLGLIWAAALRFPTRTGKETLVQVLHVVADGSARGDAERALGAQVGAAAERTGCAGVLRVDPIVTEAESAADEILHRAREDHVDLLVLGTHGESAMSRALIGGVASGVARRAECAVLLVPPAWWRARQAIEEEIRPES